MSGCVKIILDLFQESLNNKGDRLFFKFKTNVERFRIHFQANEIIDGNFPHMGVTAREGIHVLYKLEENTQWKNVDAYTTRNSPINVNMKYLVQNNQFYEILIYGPVLSKIRLLKIEVEENTELTVLNNDFSKDILVIGGIHTAGIGCTASGVMFSNILGRKLNKHIQNISFNDRNYLKLIYDKINDLNEFDTIIFELDYIRQDEDIFDEYADKIIKKLKSRCNHLICWYTLPQSTSEKHSKLNILSKRGVDMLNLSFIYDNDFSEMCTHSNNYINDAGNIMIYKKLFEHINKINQQPKKSNFNQRLRGLRNGIFKVNR